MYLLIPDKSNRFIIKSPCLSQFNGVCHLRACRPHKKDTIISSDGINVKSFKLFKLKRWIFEIRSAYKNISRESYVY